MNSDMIKKLGLTTCQYPHPYNLQWFNHAGKAKVTQICRVLFFIGSYVDHADCDVVPIEAYSLLLGHPWEFDNDSIHHVRSNTYSFMHKGKKITLVPITPIEIIQADKERAASLLESKSKN